MVVAERQGREKPAKIEQGRSEDPSEDLGQNKEHSWLAQFTEGRPRGGETYKEEPKGQGSSLHVFWVSMPSHLENVFSF